MKRLVCSELKEPVDNPEITTAHTNAGHQRPSQFIWRYLRGERAAARFRGMDWMALFEPVVGSFASDDDVVDMAFAQAR